MTGQEDQQDRQTDRKGSTTGQADRQDRQTDRSGRPTGQDDRQHRQTTRQKDDKRSIPRGQATDRTS
jgi:hypothetical protein